MLRKFSCVFSNNIPLGTSESIRGPQDVRPGPRLCRGSVASCGLRHRVGPALRSEPATVVQPQGRRRTAGWVTAAEDADLPQEGLGQAGDHAVPGGGSF